MTELWLNYQDENGAPKRILVEGEKFTIGRTPDNDLGIPISNLSRRHVQIERFADIFILSDVGSSNGTTLDDAEVTEPIAIKNGSKINLGGGVEIEVELICDDPNTDNSDKDLAKGNAQNAGSATPPIASASSISSVSASSNGNSIPLGFFILAPVLGIFILAIVGVFIFAISKDTTTASNKNGDFVYKNQPSDTDEDDSDSSDNKEDKDNKNDSLPSPSPTSSTPSNSLSSGSVTTTPTPDTTETSSTPKASDEAGKIERASISFLRRIAANDTRAFLTGKQLAVVNPKVNQFKASSALAENFKNAKKNSAQIEELARAKNLRPQFLATAALAQLGNRPGDVAKTAQSMLDTLSNLRTSLGNELAEDNLLIIAAYDQGVAGQNLAMRDTVAGLTNKFPDVSPRTVRTIWFLRDNGKLSDAQFEFALRFLAIGIITQNPRDFNVQSDAVTFN